MNLPSGSACRLYVLSHQGAPLASLLMFYFGESALYYQAGWDPDSPLASQSPGVVVMANSIRDAIQEGLRYYEFLRGDESYKTRWTKTYRKTSTLLVARSLMANNYLRAARFKDIAKRFLVNWTKGRGAGVTGTTPAEREVAAPVPARHSANAENT